MDLKPFAKAYTVETGALAGVTLWLLPYRTLAVEKVIQELNAMEPEVSYVHPDGRRQSSEPDDLKAERQRVEKARKALLDKAAVLKTEPNAAKLAALVVKTDWTREYNWSVEHQAFWCYEPLVVAVDFPDMDEHSPAELQAYARYWDTRSPITAERWQVFSGVLGTETANALFYAYQATRDKSFEPATKPEAGTGSDPLSDGAATTEGS